MDEQKNDEATPEASQEEKKCCKFLSKKCLIKIIILLVVFGGIGGYLYLKKTNKPIVTTPPSEIPTVIDGTGDSGTPPDTPTDTTTDMDTVTYESLPVYPDVSVTDDMTLEGNGRRIAYETKLGITSKDVMDFYEDELTNLGWQRVTRDVDNAQLEMFGEDQTRFRVWIYYEGTDLDGVDQLPLTFIVDFGPPGGEMLPIPVQ